MAPEEFAARERVRLDRDSKQKTGLRFVRVDELPPRPALLRGIAKHRSTYARGEYDLVAAGGNAVVVQRTELGDGVLVLIANGRAKRCKVRADGGCITRDGVYAYAIGGERTVFRSELAKADVFTVFNAPGRLSEVALVADRYLFAGGWDATYVVDLEAIERGAFATLAGLSTWVRPHAAIGSVLDGRVVWLRTGNSRTTQFVTVIDGAVVRLGKLGIGLEIEERAGQIFGRTHFHSVRVHGLDEALAVAKPRRARRPSPIALRTVDEPVPFPEPPAAWRKRVKRPIAFWRIGPTGRFVGFDYEKSGKLYWLDDAGRVHSYEPTGYPRNFDADAGTSIAIATYDDVTVLDANTCAAHTFSCKGSNLVGVAFAADRLLAIVAEDMLCLADRRGRTKHSMRGTKLRSVQAMHGGRTLVVSGWGKHKLEVFSVVGSKLVRRFRAPLDWSQSYAVGERYFVQSTTEVWFELDVSSLAK